jgi:histidine ammonia-lyase
MTEPLLLAIRSDIDLEAVRRVAWEGAGVELAAEAVQRMDAAHASLQALVDARVAEDPGALIYGITTAPGDAAATALTPEAAARRPTRLWTAASYGDALPERVVRAIVLARLANFVEGHAGARAEVARAVAAMLDDGTLPAVPAQGNGGAGEILALGRLFFGLSAEHELTPKERMALINGSPCAAALVADAALAGRGRLALAEHVLALSAESIGAPMDAYSADLEPLWDDEHETAALRSLRELLAGGRSDRQPHQAPVSYRILPRVLGRARRAQAEAERAAAVSLRSVTDNPVYLPPDEQRPLGAVISTGGYHNAQAPAAIDGLSFAWADLCQLVQRHTDRLFQHPATLPLLARDEWTMKPLHMVQAGWAEEARALAQPTLLGLGGFGQNDVPAPSFLAWGRAMAVGRCLDAALGGLAAIAWQALRAAGGQVPPALAGLAAQVDEALPVPDGSRPLGPDVQAVADALGATVFPGEVAARDRAGRSAQVPL